MGTIQVSDITVTAEEHIDGGWGYLLTSADATHGIAWEQQGDNNGHGYETVDEALEAGKLDAETIINGEVEAERRAHYGGLMVSAQQILSSLAGFRENVDPEDTAIFEWLDPAIREIAHVAGLCEVTYQGYGYADQERADKWSAIGGLL